MLVASRAQRSLMVAAAVRGRRATTSSGATRRRRCKADEAEPIASETAAAAREDGRAASRIDLLADAPTSPAFRSVDSWVVFSDLHVSPRTMGTCMDVLQVCARGPPRASNACGVMHAIRMTSRMPAPPPPSQRVHSEAAARGAGIVFLGDFWDKRGDLPVQVGGGGLWGWGRAGRASTSSLLPLHRPPLP